MALEILKSRLLVFSLLGAAAISPASVMADEETKQTWRLFVADHTQPVVRAIDLETGKLLGKYDLKSYASLTASATGKTVFAIQGDANTVNLLKTGIDLSDHGEHRDIEITEPALLKTVIEGKKPGHVVPHGDDVVVFYDRADKAEIYKESTLLTDNPEKREIGTTAPHHGVAVTMGSHVLVSVPDMNVAIKPDELPPRLGLRVLDADGKQVGDVATCTGLHGEATSARLVAFGCKEGVLVARPGGLDGPVISMVPYGSTLPQGSVSTLLGGTAMQFFLGNYGEKHVVLLDPDNSEPYRLIELPTRRVDFALDPAKAGNGYILTEDGQLHLLDVINGVITKSVKVTEPYSKDGHWRDPRPRIAVAGDTIAITDPRHGLVHLIDTTSLEETRTIPVEGQPFNIVAVGGSGAVH